MARLELWIPVKGKLIQQFGVNGEFYQANGIDVLGHPGLDFICFDKEPIYATHDGLAYTSKDSKEGLGVVVITKDVFDYNDEEAYFKTIYWHLHSWSVKDGQEVKVGDLLGYADSTGFSTGTHLHYALK